MGGQGSRRRRLLAALSVLTNHVLLLAAIHEYTRMKACDRAAGSGGGDLAQREQAAAPQEQLDPGATVVAAGGARHLLSLFSRTRGSGGVASPSSAAASRSLLSVVSDALGTLWPAPAPSDALRIDGDLSDDKSFDLASHETTWSYCPLLNKEYHPEGERPFCPQVSTAEQKWQKEWFGAHVVPGAPRRPLPLMLPCTHLPPEGYTWPEKHPQLPAPSTPAVPYANLRVKDLQDLVRFNPATPKNLYHFDCEKYDQDALGELSLAERFIPFARKVRLMLDVGAGGGSLGLLAKRKYDVQTLSTVFADWPYCEYITERGQPCILVDTMEAMPFAKFSFDVVHISWVYHGQSVDELRVMLHELNRLVRPGGYLWLRGGWSQEQLQFINTFLGQTLGYGALHYEETAKPPEVSAKVFFGKDQTLPYQVDSTSVWLKPIDKEVLADATTCSAQTQPIPI